ncbi:MAG TPA: HEAT repeat domain-containing protein [Nitrospiria bacterium]
MFRHTAFFGGLLGAVIIGGLLAGPAWADSIEEWIEKLRSPEPFERRLASSELGKTKDPRAVVPLIRLFHDPEPMVRLDASGALIQIGSPVVEPLIGELKNEDDSIFLWNAIRVLENIGDSRAIEPIEEIKENHRDPDIQQIAGYALDKLSRGKKK